MRDGWGVGFLVLLGTPTEIHFLGVGSSIRWLESPFIPHHFFLLFAIQLPNINAHLRTLSFFKNVAISGQTAYLGPSRKSLLLLENI
jgi:hypothetical protein